MLKKASSNAECRMPNAECQRPKLSNFGISAFRHFGIPHSAFGIRH
jgi:hypothetical protein